MNNIGRTGIQTQDKSEVKILHFPQINQHLS